MRSVARALFTLSVDDGHPSDLRMADLLTRHGIAATFYIPVRNREGFAVMTPAQIRCLSEQFEIGSHTLDHCFLKKMAVDDAHFQIVEGKRMLENIIGQPVPGFCYPGGKYGARELNLVHTAGFRYARTTMNLCLDGGDNPYEMPTTCQFYPHHRPVYLRNYLRSGRWKERSELLALAMQEKDWLARIAAMFEHACANNGVFHLWAHSRDLDNIDGWPKLDRFLAQVAATLPAAQRISNGQLAAMIY